MRLSSTLCCNAPTSSGNACSCLMKAANMFCVPAAKEDPDQALLRNVLGSRCISALGPSQKPADPDELDTESAKLRPAAWFRITVYGLRFFMAFLRLFYAFPTLFYGPFCVGFSRIYGPLGWVFMAFWGGRLFYGPLGWVFMVFWGCLGTVRIITLLRRGHFTVCFGHLRTSRLRGLGF